MRKNPKRYSAPGNGALPPMGWRCRSGEAPGAPVVPLWRAGVHRGRSPGAPSTLRPEELGKPVVDRLGARGNVVFNRVDGIVLHGDLLCGGSCSLSARDCETTDKRNYRLGLSLTESG